MPEGFDAEEGKSVTLSGTVAYTGTATGTLRVDFLRQTDNTSAPTLLDTITLTAPGPFSVQVPKDLGAISIVAYLDSSDNGPDADEPSAHTDGNITIGQADVTGVDLNLSDNPNKGGLKKLFGGD